LHTTRIERKLYFQQLAGIMASAAVEFRGNGPAKLCLTRISKYVLLSRIVRAGYPTTLSTWKALPVRRDDDFLVPRHGG
jgi:hypothetical protein